MMNKEINYSSSGFHPKKLKQYKKKWTLETCKLEAQKYSCIRDWVKNHPLTDVTHSVIFATENRRSELL